MFSFVYPRRSLHFLLQIAVYQGIFLASNMSQFTAALRTSTIKILLVMASRLRTPLKARSKALNEKPDIWLTEKVLYTSELSIHISSMDMDDPVEHESSTNV